MRKDRGEVRALILAVIHRPQGVRASDLDCKRTTASVNFAVLQAEGLAFPGGNHQDMRYFDSPERAKAFIPKPKAKRVYTSKPLPKGAPLRIHKPAREGWGPSDPVHITSETKVTICPTPPRALKSNTYLQFA